MMDTSNIYQTLSHRTALSVLLICILSSVSFAGIFVSVTGNDTTGNGTIVNPFRSLSKASWAANPGDTISLRGGTYITRQSVNGNNGSANQKITVMPYNNETVILDGTLSGINLYQAMVSVWKHNYTIKGIKIINSPGYGFYYAAVNNLNISGCEVYNSKGGIVRGWGNNDTIENCIFRNNVLYNEFAVLCNPNCNGGWFEGIACGCDTTCTIQSRNLVIRNNKVSRTWGEAIYVIGCLDCIVENNEIFDNFSVNLGIGKSRNIIVRNNYIYTTNDSLNRPDGNNRANAIYMANELGFSTNDYYVDSIMIANNIIAGCRTGIRFWRDPINASDSNTYSHAGIYYNVFSDLRDKVINIDSIPLPGIQPQGCRFINNIAFSAPIASIIRNIGAWTVTNNNWVNTLPVFALPPSNFIDDPSMVNPVTGGDVIGFKLQPQSVCAGKAIPVVNVQVDFWGTARDSIAPTVGVFEIDTTYNSIFEFSGGTNWITFYPNPASDILKIETKCITQIEIVNIDGKIFRKFTNKGETATIDISNFPVGIYIIQAKTDKEIVTVKLIKQ
ncbi:MAG: T9SS type A sorting domain-containing protein [Bacteroidetes bacterium]|nr:T9SS type A sorting domain-containing protein [Bacteroidota bacterium]